MKRKLVAAFVMVSLAYSFSAMAADPPIKLELVENRMIWDGAHDNSFTGMVRFKDKWYISLREATSHGSTGDGKARVIRSDGVGASINDWEWKSVAYLDYEAPGHDNWDVRDPQLTVTPDGRLMLNAAALPAVSLGHKLGWQSLVWFSKDGTDWSDGPHKIGEYNWWIWQVAWHPDGSLYGIAYGDLTKAHPFWTTRLYHSPFPAKTKSGLDFKVHVKKLTSKSSEAALLFRRDGLAVSLVRNNKLSESSDDEYNYLIGVAKGDYTDWTFHKRDAMLGGPSLIELPDGTIIAATRVINTKSGHLPRRSRTRICWLDPDAREMVQLLTLPGGRPGEGGTGYPGIVWHDGHLWVSYYSGNAGRTKIYFAKIAVAEAAVSIVVAKAKQNDAGVALAIENLTAALEAGSNKVSVVYRGPDAPRPPGHVIFIGQVPESSGKPWKPAKAEGFRIRPIELSGRRALTVEGDQRGLMYGVFKLAERIRLGEELWQIKIESAPAFPMRMFSEEGQLLDIPDIGYYSDEPPYADEKRLQREVDELKRLVDHVARLGFNTLTVLHLSFEEYIDYKYLDKEVYAPEDPHRLRSPVFCKYLTQLCDYAHARHIDVYLQLYEIQYPPRLDELYGVDLDSPNMERIVKAKTRELFERVPLDGLVITITETHPRCGYASKNLWLKRDRAVAEKIPLKDLWDKHCRRRAAKMLTMYHKACKAQGKKAVFRMWGVAVSVEEFGEVSRYVPRDAMVAIKNTGADYWLSWPTTDVITSGVGQRQPLMVLFDTFRQFDGWSRLFCYMKRWGEVVRACRDNGVVGINAWGAWSPGCLWPDWEPGNLRNQEGEVKVPVSWAGHWNSFRMFTRGFTPGQSNLYLLARLAWDPDAGIEAITRDFTALHLGPANALAAAEALMATEDAFAEEYLGARNKIIPASYIRWAMMFNPNKRMLEKAYKNTTLERIVQSNARGLKHVRKMEAAFSKTDPAKAPNPKRYELFKEGIDKTALFLRSFYLWRECWWRHRADSDLTGNAKAANAAALRQAKARLMPLFDQWRKYPEEAGHWHITNRYGKPKITPNDNTPTWCASEDTTMEGAAAEF